MNSKSSLNGLSWRALLRTYKTQHAHLAHLKCSWGFPRYKIAPGGPPLQPRASCYEK
jgi:hypothetical protein